MIDLVLIVFVIGVIGGVLLWLGDGND